MAKLTCLHAFLFAKGWYDDKLMTHKSDEYFYNVRRILEADGHPTFEMTEDELTHLVLAQIYEPITINNPRASLELITETRPERTFTFGYIHGTLSLNNPYRNLNTFNHLIEVPYNFNEAIIRFCFSQLRYYFPQQSLMEEVANMDIKIAMSVDALSRFHNTFEQYAKHTN